VVPLSHRRRPRLLAVLLGAAVLVAAGCAFQFLVSEDYDETFSTVGYQTLEIAGVDGDVQLRGMAGSTWVRARGTAEALGATRERARQNLDAARLRVRGGESGTLLLAFDPPIDMVGLVELRLDGLTELPAELGLTVELDHGDVTVTDLAGPLMIETDEGDVTVSASGSIAVVAGGEAEITVDEVNGRRVDVETEGGDVWLRLPNQDFEIVCHADGGEVAVVEQGFDDLQVDSLNGGAVVVSNGSATSATIKKLEIRSHGHDIRIDSVMVE
jgi:hypothetical protein